LIFLCYLNRSGSTYLANLLDQSPQVCVCPESDTLTELFLVKPYNNPPSSAFKILKQAIKRGPKLHAWNLPEELADSLSVKDTNFDCFMHVIKYYQSRIKPDASIIVFKAERLINLYKSFNQNLYLKEKIIWLAIIRDIRAVYASQKKTLFPYSNSPMSTSPVETAIYWSMYLNKCIKYVENKQYMTIKYEELILYQEIVLTNLLPKLSINPFSLLPNSTLYNRLPENHRMIHFKIVQPPDPTCTDRWKGELSDREIGLIQVSAKKYLHHFNYLLKDISGNTILIHLTALLLKLKYLTFFFFRKLLFKFKL
jgi:hypothetical protein